MYFWSIPVPDKIQNHQTVLQPVNKNIFIDSKLMVFFKLTTISVLDLKKKIKNFFKNNKMLELKSFKCEP